MNERYYSDIEEIKVLDDTEEVNRLLATKEWEYIGKESLLGYHVVEESASTVIQISKVLFVLGKIRKKEIKPQETPEVIEEVSPFEVAEALRTLDWKESQYPNGGDYTSSNKLKDSHKNFLKRTKKFDIGDSVIYITEKGNLKRYPKNEQG